MRKKKKGDKRNEENKQSPKYIHKIVYIPSMNNAKEKKKEKKKGRKTAKTSGSINKGKVFEQNRNFLFTSKSKKK